MGYLNNSVIQVDAILTKKGRELLAAGSSEFNITQFGLADDEIDYDLWNPSNTNGSNYYGVVIEGLPILEATPDETKSMKYKLITLPKNTTRIPIITVTNTSLEFKNPGEQATLTPKTLNLVGGNDTLGYTAILSNSDVCDIIVPQTSIIPSKVAASIPPMLNYNENAKSIAVVGKEFQLIAKVQPINDITATVTLIGNETGGQTTVSITVRKLSNDYAVVA